MKNTPRELIQVERVRSDLHHHSVVNFKGSYFFEDKLNHVSIRYDTLEALRARLLRRLWYGRQTGLQYGAELSQ